MSAAEEFKARLRGEAIKPNEIQRFLDDLSPEDRVVAIRATNRQEQARLYAAVDGFAQIKLVDLVAPSTADLETVRHLGKNTLPLFTHFEKRFCRGPGLDPERPGELSGFNFQALSVVTGPGYFVAVEDPGKDEVLVDYRRLPAEHPTEWPEIARNDRGLSRFVYGFMVDTLRRVSDHVTIGSAARKGKDLGSWFILCREA